jgi:hypothetical protein
VSADAVLELTDIDTAFQLAGEIRDVPANAEMVHDAGIDPKDDPETTIAVVEMACRYVAAHVEEERKAIVRAVATRSGPLWDWLRGSLQRAEFDRSRQ